MTDSPPFLPSCARSGATYQAVGNLPGMTTAALEPRAGRSCHNMLNSLHATSYFAPELGRELAALGITHPRAVNFAVRAAALGPVGAGAVTATFYNYKHELVARHVPAVWAIASPEDVLAARLRAVD